jgi:quercetin dioxygenase-like cupin family protein
MLARIGPPMEIIRHDAMRVLANPGVQSFQLLSPANSSSARVTITRVVLEPGAVNARHSHAGAEQVWVALRGEGRILLADEATLDFAKGDVVRFEADEIHGLQNTGPAPFEYLSVTAPPLDFRAAYATERAAGT